MTWYKNLIFIINTESLFCQSYYLMLINDYLVNIFNLLINVRQIELISKNYMILLINFWFLLIYLYNIQKLKILVNKIAKRRYIF